MLTKTEKTFSAIFILLVIAELICGSIESLSSLHYITKPAIVVSLLLFFWKEAHSISKSIKRLTVMALAFSLLGDVLLMFVQHSPFYFIFGLVAFLLAHIMYILIFLKHRNPAKRPIIFFSILFTCAFQLFLILKNGLGDLILPVLIYMLVILTMVYTSFLREGKVSKTSYIFVFLGAILFLVSDSILSLNKFYMSFPHSSFFIMLTYAFAQYFIVIGIKKQL